LDRFRDIPGGVRIQIQIFEHGQIDMLDAGRMRHRRSEIHQAEERDTQRARMQFIRNGANDVVKLALGAFQDRAE
jgi:hypothetical protein